MTESLARLSERMLESNVNHTQASTPTQTEGGRQGGARRRLALSRQRFDALVQLLHQPPRMALQGIGISPSDGAVL